MARPIGTKGPVKRPLKTTIRTEVLDRFEQHCKTYDLFWNEVLEKLITSYLDEVAIRETEDQSG